MASKVPVPPYTSSSWRKNSRRPPFDASKVPAYTRPEQRPPSSGGPTIKNDGPDPPPDRMSPLGNRPLAGTGNRVYGGVRINASHPRTTEYDPRDPRHIVLFTGPGKINMESVQLNFLGSNGQVTHSGIPRYIRAQGKIEDFARARREALMKVFAGEVKRVEDEFDALIKAELEVLKKDLEWRRRKLEELERKFAPIKAGHEEMQRAYAEARDSGNDRAREEAFRRGTILARERSKLAREISRLQVDLGEGYHEYTVTDAKTKEEVTTQYARGGKTANSTRISELRQRKQMRLRQLIAAAADSQYEAVNKAFPQAWMLRGAGQGLMVFTMSSVRDMPTYSAEATTEVNQLRNFAIGLGVVKEGRWAYSSAGKAFLRSYGMGHYLEGEVYEGIPSGRATGREPGSKQWYEEEEAWLQKALFDTIDRYRAFQAAAGPVASRDAEMARDLARIGSVVKAYGKRVGDYGMGSRASLEHRALRAEVALLRAKYLRETGLPADLDDLLVKEGATARRELDNVRAEAAVADMRLRRANAEARLARYAYGRAKRAWDIATLEAQKLAVQSESFGAQKDILMAALARRGGQQRLTDEERRVLSPEAILFFEHVKLETARLEKSMSAAQEAMRDAGDKLMAKEEVIQRTVAQMHGEGEFGPVPPAPKLVWHETRTGGGDFIIKHGRFAGVAVRDIPIGHLTYIASGAQFEKNWSWKGVTVEKGAARMLSPVEFERHKGDRIDLPMKIRFQLHSDMERANPGGGRRQIGNINFRQVREYLGTPEGRARLRSINKGRRDSGNIGRAGTEEELSRRRHATVARYSFDALERQLRISHDRSLTVRQQYADEQRKRNKRILETVQGKKGLAAGTEDFGFFQRHMAPYFAAQKGSRAFDDEDSRTKYWYDYHMKRLQRSKMSEMEKMWLARSRTFDSLQDEMRRDNIKTNLAREVARQPRLDRTDMAHGLYTYYLEHYSPEEARRKAKEAMTHVEKAKWRTPAAWTNIGGPELGQWKKSDGSNRTLADLDVDQAIEQNLRFKVGRGLRRFAGGRELNEIAATGTPGARALAEAAIGERQRRLIRTGALGGGTPSVNDFLTRLRATKALRGHNHEFNESWDLSEEEMQGSSTMAPLSEEESMLSAQGAMRELRAGVRHFRAGTRSPIIPLKDKPETIDALDLAKTFKGWVSTDREWYQGTSKGAGFHFSVISGLTSQTSTAHGLDALREAANRAFPIVDLARRGALTGQDVQRVLAEVGYAGLGNTMNVHPILLHLHQLINDRERALHNTADPTYMESLNKRVKEDSIRSAIDLGHEGAKSGGMIDLVRRPGEYAERSGHTADWLQEAAGSTPAPQVEGEDEDPTDMGRLVIDRLTGEIYDPEQEGADRHPADLSDPYHQKQIDEPIGRRYIIRDPSTPEDPSSYMVGPSEGETFTGKERRSRTVQVVNEEAGEAVMYSYGHHLDLVDPGSSEYHSAYAGPGRQAAMDTLGEGVRDETKAQKAIDEQQIAEWLAR